ncbi:13434_t:CDS:2, partial [Dentiscutata erythropus]
MTVVSSTHLTIKRNFGSNRYPLKVFLVGVAQDVPKEINSESVIISTLVNDYARQSINEGSFNVSETKNSDISKEKSEFEASLIIEDSHASKYTRLEDEKDDCVDKSSECSFEESSKCKEKAF